jgi:hypothetical protein
MQVDEEDVWLEGWGSNEGGGGGGNTEVPLKSRSSGDGAECAAEAEEEELLDRNGSIPDSKALCWGDRAKGGMKLDQLL